MTTYTIVKTANTFKIVALHPPAPGFKADRHTTIAEGSTDDAAALRNAAKLVAFANLANTLATVVESAQSVQQATSLESLLPE